MSYNPFPPANAANGGAVPAQTLLVGGSDGTDIRSLATDTGGQVKVLVENTPAVTLASTTITGTVTVVGDAANGAPVAGNPVLVAGSDGTDARSLSTDASGRLFIQEPNNVLLATTAESITSTVTSLSETAGVTGRCVVVTIKNIDTSQMPYTCSVRVRNTTNGITGNWQSVGLLQAAAYGTLYFNLPVTNGDTVVIDVIAPGSLVASKTDVTVVLVPLEIATLLRPDGRGMPLGAYVKESSVTSADVTAQAAVTGWQILVSSLIIAIVGTQAATIGYDTLTINGTSTPFALISGAVAGTLNAVYPQGLLGDPTTALTFKSGGAVSYTSYNVAVYDLVPA